VTRKRAAGLLLLVAAVAAVVWLGLRNNDRMPSAQITRTACVKGWSPAPPFVFSGEPYLWLNSHEILHFRGNQMHGFSAITYDTKTQKEQPEPNLSCVQTGHVISASPDGQWVLWDTQKYDDPPTIMAATRRADGKTIRWRYVQHQRSAGFWLPDSRRWVDIAEVSTGQITHGHRVLARRLVIYSVDHPGFQTFVIPADTGAEYVMGVTSQGKVILTDSFGERAGRLGQAQSLLPLREISINGPRAAARIILVPLPASPPAATSLFYLAPQGDRMLWSCLSFQPPSLLSRAKGFIRHTSPYGLDKKDVWLCHLDGSPPTHLGTWSSSDMGDFFWNPDGKHISLAMQNELYSVPVP